MSVDQETGEIQEGEPAPPAENPALVRIPKQFIVNLKGKDYPLFAGVLHVATERGLRSLITRVVQIPSPENGQLAVVLARAEFEDGRVFEDVGDCSPASTSPQLAAASLRIASTRAKGRVLRDSINCGTTLLEELPDLDHLPETGNWEEVRSGNGGAIPGKNGELKCSACPKALTQAQRDFSVRKYGVGLCPECQKGRPPAR